MKLSKAKTHSIDMWNVNVNMREFCLTTAPMNKSRKKIPTTNNLLPVLRKKYFFTTIL